MVLLITDNQMDSNIFLLFGREARSRFHVSFHLLYSTHFAEI